MSCFLVSDKQLNAILNFARATFSPSGDNWLPCAMSLEKIEEVGAVLFNANVKSVNQRYPASAGEPCEPFKFVGDIRNVIGVAQFAKALDCLEYQSCDWSDWDTSDAYKIVCELRCKALKSLWGYKEATWTID